MRLPQFKKILREDLKGAPDWVSTLINVVNPFMESTYQSLNQNLSLNDNLASFVKEITYKTSAAYPVGVPSISFQSTLKTRAIGVQVLQAYDRQSYQAAAGPVYVPWVESEGQIIISAITGLEAEKIYTIRLVVWA